jgi:putative aminopeptidase FrvX
METTIRHCTLSANRTMQATLLRNIADVMRCCDGTEVRNIICMGQGGAANWNGGVLVAPHPNFDILLCAHTDRHFAGIGYDDGIGVAIALTALECLPNNVAVAAVFTDDEETGGQGIQQMLADGLHVPRAALVLDRCASWEVVDRIHDKRLCERNFAERLREAISEETGLWYEITEGMACDALHLADVAPTVNLSIGVSGQHTSEESFNYAAAWGTLQAVVALCEQPSRWLP